MRFLMNYFDDCDFSYTRDQGEAKGGEDRQEEDCDCRVSCSFQILARLHVVQRKSGRERRQQA